MRKLMWFAVGFAAACGLCAYGMMETWLLPVAIGVIVLAVAAAVIVRKRKLFRILILVLAGCMTGMAWFGIFHYRYIRPVTGLDGQLMELTITASGYSRTTDYGTTLEGTTQIAERSYPLWIYLSDRMELQPGDSVSATFQIRLTTPGGLRESASFQGKGIFLVAYQRGDVTVSRAETVAAKHYPAVLAERIKGRMEQLFPEDVYPFTKALLLGDAWDLDPVLDTAFQISGIRHIIAVSGLHISILYGLICLVTLKNRFLTALVGMPVLALFAGMAGFTPSALRACIMVWLMLLAKVFDRDYDPPTALSFAVLVLLVMNPLAVMSASLQLSAGCVAGIMLFNRPINNWLKGKLPGPKGREPKLWRMVCTGISVTLSAMSLTTPLCAYYFGLVSLVGPLTNLLTLWVVNVVFNGLAITVLLSPVSPAAAAWLAGLLAWPIRYVQELALAFSSFPLAAVYTQSIYIVFWLVFVYVLLAVFLWMKDKKPGILICCGAVGLCVALLASWLEPLASDTRITMLDVGQGQSIILQSEGKTFLVDCGGDDGEQTADLIAGTLLSQGTTRLDGIILTHFDRDHAGGLPYLLNRVDTDYLFLPDTRNEFELPETDAEVLYVWEDMELSFGETSLRIYGPVYSGLSNENSLCVLFDAENCDILVTGDRSAFGERMLLRNRDLPDVDILVAGHHGAADSSSQELLEAVTPETVLISVSENNTYGHPAPELLERLAQFGCTVCRTDEHGTITIRR